MYTQHFFLKIIKKVRANSVVKIQSAQATRIIPFFAFQLLWFTEHQIQLSFQGNNLISKWEKL